MEQLEAKKEEMVEQGHSRQRLDSPKADPYRRLPQKKGRVERLFFHSTFLGRKRKRRGGQKQK